jgi:hypothetical protein
MLVQHNGHYIKAAASQQRDGLWIAQILVTSIGPPLECTRFSGQREFAAVEEAEQWGIALGKQWIDSGKPLPLNSN